jgi:orotidine-5'-phosphate decarboxylase
MNTTTLSPVIERYNARVGSANSLLCVGLDSDHTRLPARFADHETPQFAFNRWIIEQTHEYASAYKPNMAFYEARGSQGIHELKLTLDYLREHHPDILTVCDAKRADIGSTNVGYVEAVFDTLGFDSITLHPYLGSEAMQPFLARADKGCIILCRTSNPGASEFQDLNVGGVPLWHRVAETVRDRWNANGNCMLVVGATYPEEMSTIREIVPEMPFLVPGIGAQGGDIQATISAGQDARGGGLIVSASRGVIFSDDPAAAARQFRNEMNLYRLVV